MISARVAWRATRERRALRRTAVNRPSAPPPPFGVILAMYLLFLGGGIYNAIIIALHITPRDPQWAAPCPAPTIAYPDHADVRGFGSWG